MDKDQTTTPGTPCPTLFDECVGSLTSPAIVDITVTMQETGPTVYRPYPRGSLGIHFSVYYIIPLSLVIITMMYESQSELCGRLRELALYIK